MTGSPRNIPPSAADLLLPRPRRLQLTGGRLQLSRPTPLLLPSANPAIHSSAERLAGALAACGCEVELVVAGSPLRGSTPIHLRLDPRSEPRPQGYHLRIQPTGIEIVGDDEPGLFYGVVTACQWIRLHTDRGSAAAITLPTLEISDHPDFLHRGALLDISRNRVPTMESLKRWIEHLAEWKVNQLQLYTEHTFAYRDHEAVWRDASPMTAEEIKELDRFCSRRFIELVPNQNSFGHFHRWLVHPLYRPLAERPEGVQHPFGPDVEPFSLCPTDPASLELIESLWDELLAQFASRQANAGLDETFDLGTGRSARACERRGVGRVYLDYLLEVRRILLERGRRLQFWADMILSHRELVEKLPSDVIPLVWGYEARHPFEEELQPFSEAGLAFYVCPGTSSWNSLAGRADNALANLSNAARAGQRAGATGILVTDWGDNGHLQPPVARGIGWLAGAACGWRASTETDPDLVDWAALLDAHLFAPGADLGSSAMSLARVYRLADAPLRNGSVLFRLLLHANEDLTHERFEHLRAEGLERALVEIEGIGSLLDRPRRDDELFRRELWWAAATLAFSCRLGIARLASGRAAPLSSLPWRARRALRRELRPLIREFQELWLESSRAGGLEASSRYLSRVESALR